MTIDNNNNTKKQKQLRQLHRRLQKVPGGGKSRIQRRLVKKIKQNENGAKKPFGLMRFWYAGYLRNGIEEKEGEGGIRTWKGRSCKGTFSSDRTIVLRKKWALSEMKRGVLKHGLAHQMPGLGDIAWEVQLHTHNKEQNTRYIGTDEEWRETLGSGCDILVHFPSYVY